MTSSNGIFAIGLLALLASSPLAEASGASLPHPVLESNACRIALVPHAGATRADLEIQRFQMRAREAPDPTAYLERLGWAFIAKARESFDVGYYTLAEQSATCMAERQPDLADALLLHGHVRTNQHRFSEAEAIGRRLVTRRGLWLDHALLGDALMEQGKLDAAISAYQAMMDMKPGPQAYSRAAQARWMIGDLKGAISMMRLAAGSFGDPEAVAWAQVRLAQLELQAGNGKTARDILVAVLAVSPEYAPALLAHGRLQISNGDPAEAVEILARAVKLNPLPEYQWAYLEALQIAGQPAKAAEIAAELQANAAADRRTYALYLASIGQDTATAVAVTEAELAIRADLFTVDANAWALRSAGRIEEAVESIGRALAVGAVDTRLFYHAAIIFAEAGQPVTAAKWWAKASAHQQMLLPSERAHLVRASMADAPPPSVPARP